MLIRKLFCRALFCTVALVLASFHSAYGQDRPDHKNALDQIRKMLGDDRIFEITKLAYVNGTQTDINHYVVAATYTRVFKVSSKTLYDKDGLPIQNPVNAADAALTVLSYLVNASSGNLYGRFEPGDSFDISCQFVFLGTENGWVLQDRQTFETIVARHTEHADAMDAQEKQDRDADKAKQDEATAAKTKGEVAAYTAAKDRHDAEIENACSSGQQMIIAGQGTRQALSSPFCSGP
jgi:hypothetical protein